MTVNSYPELFSTLLGWQQYQNLWDIIVNTGLAFIPFIVMIIKNTVEPFLSQEAKSAYTISLRRVEFSLVTMILTIMIACQPMLTLDPDVLHFKPVCNSSIDATPGNSGTTYDGALSNVTPAKVPLWWYGITGLAHGITAAATVGLGCKPDLRETETKLSLARIQSAPLRLEVQQFISSCWLPAFKKYNQDNSDEKKDIKKYGYSDLEWAGSRFFLNEPGYYDVSNPQIPVVDFPYDPNRDFSQGKTHGQWGSPTCKDWWSQPNIGLYYKVKNGIDPGLWDKINQFFTGENASDSAIKQIIENSITNGYRDGMDQAELNTSSAYSNSDAELSIIGGGIFSGVTTDLYSTIYLPKMYMMISFLPLVQAYLLMASYIFLALALPASGYRFGTVMSLTAVIFSIIFWSYLWQLAGYVDSTMIQALFPVGGFYMDNKNYGGDPIVLNMIAVLMYFIVPLFWTMFMGWAGIQVGSGITGLIDRTSGASAGAGGLAGVAGKVASMGMSALKMIK